ncbi:WD40 repeat domain-containing protein [Streptomyces olivaceus]|uniref:WD40 repeat domain-containing protein n=1 Tax=Streptomyces olivaceus TaxID=47716 RepID=UPI0036E6FCFD
MSGTDRGVLADILLGQVGRDPDGSRRWAEADPYLLRHAVQHAVEGGRLDELLADPEFLVYADPATLIPALPGASGPDALIAATVYRSALEDLPSALPEQRRQYLAISGSRVGARTLARRLSRPFGSPALALEPLFSTGSEIKPAVRAVFDDGDFRVYAVVVARTGGRQVVVTTGTDREGYDTIVRFRDLRTGEPTLPPITITGDREQPGRVSRYQGVIAVSEVDGAAVVVLRSEGGLIVRSVATGEIVREHPTGEGYCLATGVLAGRAVAAVNEEPGILVRDVDTGAPVGPAIRTPSEHVCSLEISEIGDHPVLVYATHSGRYGDEDPGATCQVIDLHGGVRIGPVHRSSPRSGTAIARLGLHEGRPVVVVGPQHVHTDMKGQRYHPDVGIRDVFTGEERFPAWTQYEGVRALAVTLMDGHAVLVAGNGRGVVTVRDLNGGGEPYELLSVGIARGSVHDLGIARADGRVLVLAACDDGKLRVADLSPSDSGPATPSPGHQIGVESIALARVGGHPVVLSGGHLGDLYRRDARTGTRTALLRHGDLRVTDIAVTTVAQHPVVVTGSPRAGVRLHDLASGQPLADYRTPGDDKEWVYSVDVLPMDGRPVIVGAGYGGLVWMWDLLGGECLLRWKVPDGDAHRAVWRALLVDGAPVLAGVQAEYGPSTGHIALYDLASRTRRDVAIKAFEGYNSTQCLAVHEHRGVPLVAFADFEGTLAVWDARTGTLVSRVVNDAGTERPQTALACGEVGGRAVCVVGTQAGHLGVHDMLTGERIAGTVLPGGWIRCVDIDDDGLVAVGYGQEVAVLDMGGAVGGGGA